MADEGFLPDGTTLSHSPTPSRALWPPVHALALQPAVGFVPLPTLTNLIFLQMNARLAGGFPLMYVASRHSRCLEMTDDLHDRGKRCCQALDWFPKPRRLLHRRRFRSWGRDRA